jgi:hypothetical protein
LWERVQTILAIHKETWTMRDTNADLFLGNGLLFCQCGCRMYLKYDRRRGKPPVYVCSSFRTDNGPCGASRLRAELTDKAIWDAASAYFTDLTKIHHSIQEGQKSQESKEAHSEVAAAEKALVDLEKSKRSIQRMVAVDDTDEDALKMYENIKRDISDGKIRLAKAKAEVQVFGSGDAWKTAQIIMRRFSRRTALTLVEKRTALEESRRQGHHAP